MGNCCSTANEDGLHPRADHSDRATPADDHMENEFSDSLCVNQSHIRGECSDVQNVVDSPPASEPRSECLDGRGPSSRTKYYNQDTVSDTAAPDRVSCPTSNPLVSPAAQASKSPDGNHVMSPPGDRATYLDEAPNAQPDLDVSFEQNEGARGWSPQSEHCAIAGVQAKTGSDDSVSLDSLDSQYCEKVTRFLQSIPVLPPRHLMVAWLRQLPEEPWNVSPLNHNEAFDFGHPASIGF